MRESTVRALNRPLALAGLAIVEKCIGHWYVTDDGLRRESIRYGWRLTSAAEARRIRPGETQLDRLLRSLTERP